ncbi:MAG: cupredoxin domain-containing protein [Candidatus Pacebacteria bacterium]|nr:cupredoxin domain-containing protein [Candidatus Paceibacterota bacterium]
MKKKILIGIGVLVLLIAGGLYLAFSYQKPTPTTTSNSSVPVSGVLNSSTPGTVTVTLTKDGFVPNEISLKKGESITFKNTTGNLFWPASNLHPSHLLYSEFDPQEPIQPTDTWTFVFEKTGEWKFHDHLSPYFTGTITVKE